MEKGAIIANEWLRLALFRKDFLAPHSAIRFPLWLQEREWHPEKLDDPHLDEKTVQGALAGLARLNFISRSAGILWAEIKKLAHALRVRSLRVLDVATGGGDIPMTLLRKSQKSRLALTVSGCDLNEHSLHYARNVAAKNGYQIEFFRHDAVTEPLPQGYDVVTCSLFLHHLQEKNALTLLTRMAEAAHHLVLVNDLQRSPLNYAMVWLGSRLLSRSPVVRTDALLSMKNAFTAAEVSALAQAAEWKDFAIHTRFPARLLLSWKKS
jgi:2-polyprenyl-3-methyl-5-hydroxy-6-metoxy-1,4-benzoquinol methylase